jgi:hypothetical protein
MSGISLRFYVAETTLGPGDPPTTAKVVLLPAYAQGANAEWAAATPSGRIDLTVSNPAAIEVIEEWRKARTDLHLTARPVDDA